jgi:hypothetical protein
MDSRLPGSGRLIVRAVVFVVGIALVVASSSVAADGPYHDGRGGNGVGTLGYGGPGLYPGYQGFGLSYHLGYGYGGSALGPGALGGYPFYGGPGYPHGEPPLRRFGHLVPFPYSGGPGYPYSFQGVGPLVAGQEVVTIGSHYGAGRPGSDYGCFTGVLPYPETVFAPFTSSAAAGGSSAPAP